MFPTPALACFIQYLLVDVVFMLCLVYVMVMFIVVHNILLPSSGKFPATGTMERLGLGVHMHGVIAE